MSGETAITIAGMALILYATRTAGFWLVGRVPALPAAEFDQLAGVTLVALTAPAIVSAGTPGLLGCAVAAIVALRSGNVLLSMAAAMIVVWVARL